jgi:hypothetical protein
MCLAPSDGGPRQLAAGLLRQAAAGAGLKLRDECSADEYAEEDNAETQPLIEAHALFFKPKAAA